MEQLKRWREVFSSTILKVCFHTNSKRFPDFTSKSQRESRKLETLTSKPPLMRAQKFPRHSSTFILCDLWIHNNVAPNGEKYSCTVFCAPEFTAIKFYRGILHLFPRDSFESIMKMPFEWKSRSRRCRSQRKHFIYWFSARRKPPKRTTTKKTLRARHFRNKIISFCTPRPVFAEGMFASCRRVVSHLRESEVNRDCFGYVQKPAIGGHRQSESVERLQDVRPLVLFEKLQR